MATVLTTQIITNDNSSEELVVVIGEDAALQSSSIAIDYSAKLTRLADAFDLHNSYLVQIKDDVERLRYLSDPDSVDNGDENHGTGLRVSQPYGIINSALLHGSLVKAATALDLDNAINNTDATREASAISALEALLQQLRNSAFFQDNK